MELHPDRNYGNVEATTKLFAEIQSAYEVLSDPQERSWYDSHRSSILRGASEVPGEHYEHNVRVTTSDDLLRTFAHFTGQIDFSDSSSGFYGILRSLFDTLAKEELEACDWEGLDCIDYPSFGHADDDYEEVVKPFYATWNGFATQKTFAWMDVYRTVDAVDRRVRRIMEKENRRFRDAGIREFNDTVRQLVAFVRKRDPRYKPNTQTQAERQKIIRDAATAQAARSRAANRARLAEKQSIPQWAKQKESIEEEDQEVQEEEPEEQFECVVCRKTFKSEQQFGVHEKSKKHLKAVQRLTKDMHCQDQALDLNEGINQLGTAAKVPEEAEPKDVRVTCSDQNLVSEQHSGILPSKGSGGIQEITPISDSSLSPGTPSSMSSKDDDYATRQAVEERVFGKSHEKNEVASSEELSSKPSIDIDGLKLADSSSEETDAARPSKPGKAKEKRARKAAQVSGAGSAAEVSVDLSDSAFNPLTIQFKCATCNSGFPSKTRLFNHIKDFGHAQPISRPGKRGKGKKK